MTEGWCDSTTTHIVISDVTHGPGKGCVSVSRDRGVGVEVELVRTVVPFPFEKPDYLVCLSERFRRLLCGIRWKSWGTRPLGSTRGGPELGGLYEGGEQR